MSITKKWLVGAAAIIITLMLISMGFDMFSRTKAFSENVIGAQDAAVRREQEYSIVKYDGNTINGSMALNYLKEMVTIYEIPVTLIKGSVEIVVTTSDQFSQLRDIDADGYIDPLRDYECMVCRDVNDMICGVDIVLVP